MGKYRTVRSRCDVKEEKTDDLPLLPKNKDRRRQRKEEKTSFLFSFALEKKNQKSLVVVLVG